MNLTNPTYTASFLEHKKLWVWELVYEKNQDEAFRVLIQSDWLPREECELDLKRFVEVNGLKVVYAPEQIGMF